MRTHRVQTSALRAPVRNIQTRRQSQTMIADHRRFIVGNFLDSYADVTACNSSNLDGALSGNHDYACESDDCLGDSGELVPLGGYLSMTATWDAVNFAFTSLPTALPVLWNGAADAATGTDTIYGRLAAETPMTSASYSISTSANSYTSSTASSTSMLSYSSESPTVYTNTYTPSDTPMTSASTTSASTTSSSTTSSASETDAFANASTYMVSPASSTPDVSEHFNNGSRSGLNTPEIVGIAVGCGLAVVALILAIFCCRRRRKNRTLHNTAGSHNNPRHFGLRRESDVLETASMIAEADPAHELPVELGGTTWVEAPEKGSPPEKDKSAHESSPPDSVMDRKESKARVSHEQDSAQV